MIEVYRKMKLKKSVIILVITAIAVTTLLFALMPERIEDTITVATSTGETAVVTVDILYFSNLFLPSYVKGSLSVDGVEYIDQYTMLEKFPGVKDNRLLPAGWWKSINSIPYNMTFLKSDCTDGISAQLNRLVVLDVVLNKGICKIHYMQTDENNITDTVIEGVSFWGPAQNGEEARKIAKDFGYH